MLTHIIKTSCNGRSSSKALVRKMQDLCKIKGILLAICFDAVDNKISSKHYSIIVHTLHMRYTLVHGSL